MMASDGVLLASRLREARETLGLTQGDVAETVGLQRTAATAIEAGHRRVSGLELRRFARLYRRPADWFLGADAPQPDAGLLAAVAHLSLADQERVVQFARFLAHQAAQATRTTNAEAGGAS